MSKNWPRILFLFFCIKCFQHIQGKGGWLKNPKIIYKIQTWHLVAQSPGLMKLKQVAVKNSEGKKCTTGHNNVRRNGFQCTKVTQDQM